MLNLDSPSDENSSEGHPTPRIRGVKHKIKRIRLKPEDPAKQPQRRGRPEANRIGAKSIPKHYLAIWQAELKYIFLVSQNTNSFSSDTKTGAPLDVRKLISSKDQDLFNKYEKRSHSDLRLKRVMDVLKTLYFSKAQQVARELYKFYMLILRLLDENLFEQQTANSASTSHSGVSLTDRCRETKDRESLLDSLVEKVASTQSNWSAIRLYRSQSDNFNAVQQEQAFRRLIRIVAHSFVAAYEDDQVMLDVADYWSKHH